MVLFRYDLSEPYLMWASITPDGTVAHMPDPIAIDMSYMIHDFTPTSSHRQLVPAVTIEPTCVSSGGYTPSVDAGST